MQLASGYIREVIVTTTNVDGTAHIAPMGIRAAGGAGEQILIAPFQPSRTLDNLCRTRTAVVNHCDDVRIFAGCLTGRRDWPVLALDDGQKDASGAGHSWRLKAALSHLELRMVEHQPDDVRPRCLCAVQRSVNHAPFAGFNRAQAAVLEAAILVSRLDRLPEEKVRSELDTLSAQRRRQDCWRSRAAGLAMADGGVRGLAGRATIQTAGGKS